MPQLHVTIFWSTSAGKCNLVFHAVYKKPAPGSNGSVHYLIAGMQPYLMVWMRMKESLNEFKKNNNGNPIPLLPLPFSHNSAWKEKLSEHAVQTVKGGKGDEKAKEWERERNKGRERKREIPLMSLLQHITKSTQRGLLKMHDMHTTRK